MSPDPRMDGHTLLLTLRKEYPQYSDMPFLFLSAYSNRSDMLEGLELGADDYLTKPIDFDILLTKVKTRLDMIEKLKKKNQKQLEFMAYHDALTGLPNRAQFEEHLDIALNGFEKNEKFAVLFLDLSRFKKINDTLGHLNGDMLLKEVGSRLTECIGPNDMVARMGGDEFAILQINQEQPTASLSLSAKIHQTLKKSFNLNENQVSIDTGIGIALAPENGRTQSELLRNADLALYRAKDMGPGSHCLFATEMAERAREQNILEGELWQAYENNEFELHYQPIYDVHENKIASFEALIRWNHPTGKKVFPDVFIKLAEDIGLIHKLGNWILNEACQEAIKWPDHVRVAINLSPVQFKNKNLPLLVASALARSSLSASRLELEITESTILENEESTLDALDKIKSLGVSLALDDFGTGYSSLSYLQNYPFDKLKIDRAFLLNVMEEGNGVAILRTIIKLAKELGMNATAEGIETLEQLDIIRQEGSDFAQGYYFSRPLPANEIGQFFEDNSDEELERAS